MTYDRLNRRANSLGPLMDFTASQMDISSDDRVLQFAEFGRWRR